MNHPVSNPRDLKPGAVADLEARVEGRFGLVPNFFQLAPEAPEITRNLWGFAEFAYLDSPLPSLIKERLFVYLSQFCEVRYCISRHVGFLVGLGRPSGDKDVVPETAEQVVRLLQRPLPAGKALDPHIEFCRQKATPLLGLPEPESSAEESLFACATHVFLQDADAPRCLGALRQALGCTDFQHLLVFLAFVRTAHFWTKVHPELSEENDIAELLNVHDVLGACVRNNPDGGNSDAVRALRDELDDLRREEADLHSRAAQARFLASIIESSDDAIISETLDGIIQSWNVSAERMFGYTEDEAVGRHVSMLIPPDRRIEEERTIAQVASGERVNHFDTVRLNARGKRIPVALTVSPIKDAAGKIVAASMIARDITIQKRAAQALLDSEERVRSALEGAELGVWNIIDPESMELQTDQRFREIFGGVQGDLLEYDTAIGIIHPDDQARVQDAVAAAIRPVDPVPYEIEYRVVWPDASVHWVFAKGKARFDTASDTRQLASFDGTVMDITEQRTLREQLRDAAARLSEADRRKDEFLATLAHELRNPLAPIRTGLDALSLADGDPLVRERIRRMMVNQTEHVVHLVDDLLDVSRITRGKMELRRSRVDLAVIVQSAIESTNSLMVDAGHELTVKLPESPVYLDADGTRLAQILSNLLNNAGKYTRPCGQIWLTVDASDDEVTITVRDNGLGIPEDMQTTIFEMFGQAHRSRDADLQSGLGIGLTLVRRLVEMHGGTIGVRSEGIDEGSEFTVRLPRQSAAAPASRSGEPAQQKTSLRVLVVDDNREAAETLGMLIELLGNEVRTAHDGEQAVRLASEFSPDVVFMDIGMPRMNGNEAARCIRRESWGRTMKLVALTGWSQEVDRQQTRDAGFDTHLVKPVNSATIGALLAECEPTDRR